MKAFYGLGFWALCGCGAMQQVQALGAEAAEKVGSLVEDPMGAASEQVGQDGSNATCCVNGSFYECPNGAAALKCLGNPIKLTTCTMDCASNGDCALQCVGQYGPNPSSCVSTPARNAECSAPPPAAPATGG